MITEAHNLREQAQSCLFLAGLAEEGEIGDVLRSMARNLVAVAERLEGVERIALQSSSAARHG